MRSSRPFVVPLILLGLMVAQALADDEGKPFAEARIVLQMADGDAESQTRVLNVANNLIKHYGGPDFVDIEIVAYGPGLSLLYPGNANEERISSLLANDVRFVSCMNTVESPASAQAWSASPEGAPDMPIPATVEPDTVTGMPPPIMSALPMNRAPDCAESGAVFSARLSVSARKLTAVHALRTAVSGVCAPAKRSRRTTWVIPMRSTTATATW
jgi:intracellular sulfur oxidation DsrE/DsrF family protein